jgi:hypothetical protein
MAVNVQDDVDQTIFQLGMIVDQGLDAQPHFVYADTNATAHNISSPTPVDGHRYEFRIAKNVNNGRVRMVIYENGTQLWIRDSATTWTGNMKHAWWGYETGRSTSQPGIQDSAPAADLVGQYSYANDFVATHDVTNISPFTTCPNSVPCSDYWPSTDELVSGASNQVLNVRSP